MKKIINPEGLSGEDLFDFYLIDHPDKEYSSLVQLLPIACGDMQTAFDVLEKIVKNNQKLVAVYPGLAEELPNVDNLQYIGPIPDGGLYIES